MDDESKDKTHNPGGATGPNGPGPSDRPFVQLERIKAAVLAFQGGDFLDYRKANQFFESFGGGQFPGIYERFYYYELLLNNIIAANEEKYLSIHKGNPFYFLGWTAFDFGDYEKAVFYMDLAISEDQKLPVSWIDEPAGHFLTLKKGGNQAAWEITDKLRNAVSNELKRFAEIPSHIPLDNVDDFVTDFVLKLIEKPEGHSIITAIYSYILEYSDRLTMLKLRGEARGSIEPFLVHLFKGALIFESLLKNLYPTQDDGRTVETIGGLQRVSKFREDFVSEIHTQSDGFAGIIRASRKGPDNLQKCFDITAQIRNTSGHNLALPDEFNNPINYTLLYEQTINALLLIIAKKYGRRPAA